MCPGRLGQPFVCPCSHLESTSLISSVATPCDFLHWATSTITISWPHSSLFVKSITPVFQVHGHHINRPIHTSTHLISLCHVPWLLLLQIIKYSRYSHLDFPSKVLFPLHIWCWLRGSLRGVVTCKRHVSTDKLPPHWCLSV